MATHSSILAWKILWTVKPGRLQSIGLQKSWTQLSMHACTCKNYVTYMQIFMYLENMYTYILFLYPAYIRRCLCAAQSHPTTCNPMDCSPSGSSVYRIFQARILEWVAISFSRGSSQPRDRFRISCVSGIGRQILYHWCHLESHIRR